MIQFENVSVSFRQKGRELSAVNQVSLTIKKGEIFGIVGSSGAGKSTLLRTINLLQRPTSGKVIVDGKNVTDLKGSGLRGLRRQIGMIFQQFNLAESKTVYENIAFVLHNAGKKRRETEKRVAELLRLVGLSDKSAAYPAQLSGGQKQRVAIARALANDAKILLCDEPTSALDVETTSAILNLLQDLNRKYGITIVVITHELDVVKSICSRVAVMDGGSVVEEGEVYQIFTQPRHAFTRQLVERATRLDFSDQVLSHIEGKVVKLVYQGEAANNPVLSDTAGQFPVSFNILLGKIEYIGGNPLGILYVQLLGESAATAQAVEYLKTHTAHLEVIDYGRLRSA